MYINPLVVLGLYIGSDGVINLPLPKAILFQRKLCMKREDDF